MTRNPIFYSPGVRKLKRKRAAKNRKDVPNIQRKQLPTIRPIVIVTLLLQLIGRNNH